MIPRGPFQPQTFCDSVIHNSFSKDIFPDIQPKPPLMQLEAIFPCQQPHVLSPAASGVFALRRAHRGVSNSPAAQGGGSQDIEINLLDLIIPATAAGIANL